MSRMSNSEKDFDLMYKTGIILIVVIIIIGIVAVVFNYLVKGNAEWYVPVKVVDGGEEGSNGK